MDYFKKVGRPTDEEQAVINMIESLIKEKGVPRVEIPQCQSLDDLLEVQNLLEAYVSDKEVKTEDLGHESTENEPETDEVETGANTEQVDEPEEVETNTQTEEHTENVESETEIEETNVLDESQEDEATNFEDAQEPESESVEQEPDKPNFISNDYDPFAEEIKERSYTKQTESVQTEKTDSEDAELNLEESAETPLEDLNPNTKRKVAEKTANSILKGYAKLAPQPFKWLAKINEGKIERMHFEGEIDITLEVSEGTTFDEYMRQTNEQVDEIFEVDEETLDEIREPLIDVLMEQKMELTPQQRLTMAVVSHLFQMFTVAISLRRQNNRILEYQKRMTLMAAQRAA